MRSIIAIALVFFTTFAGASTLLTMDKFQAITKEHVEGKVAGSRAYTTPTRNQVSARQGIDFPG